MILLVLLGYSDRICPYPFAAGLPRGTEPVANHQFFPE